MTVELLLTGACKTVELLPIRLDPANRDPAHRDRLPWICFFGMGAKTSSRERAQHGVLYPCARVQNCVPAGMRASAPRCDRLQARRRTALLPTISTFAIDLRAPFAARLDARALRRSCARTLKLWPARARKSTMALSARACCAGAAAKAPTQRVARRNRRRRWCLGLRLDTHVGTAAAAAAATEATTFARHRRHATLSSASLRSPRGRRAIGRVVCTQIRCRRRRLQRRPDGHGGKEASTH